MQPIGDLIRTIHNMAGRTFDKKLREHELDFLTSGNGRIIGYLCEKKNEDVFQKDLEVQFGITRSTASKVVNLMVEKGYIVRERVPGDARLKKLVLTPKAEVVAEFLYQNCMSMEETLLSGFSGAERVQFREYLERAKDNISKCYREE